MFSNDEVGIGYEHDWLIWKKGWAGGGGGAHISEQLNQHVVFLYMR